MKKYNLLNNLLGWACFVVAAITYLLTIEPTASFWDCPEFISQGAKLEVGHPPGNPIFMLAARFFVTIFGNDISNAAVAVNSMSALLSAATILLLFWTITHLVKRLIVPDTAESVGPWQMALIFGGGVCGALAYTWSDTFWFSAVEGEVYAFSSFCTALVFWLILKWENRADQPHSDRYLILIGYIIGVSIAVHLLNLLCIPAIVLVYYYRKYRNVSATGSLLALLVSFVIVGLILYGLVPGFVKVSQWFELFFVNDLGAGYNVGVLVYAIIVVAVFIWAIRALWLQKSNVAIKTSFWLAIALSGMLFIGSWWIGLLLILALGAYLIFACNPVPVRVFNVIILSVFLIFVGYSSYALLLIRSSANTPMNQNAPDNVFALSSYLNREQYGDRPLFYGGVFAEELSIEEYPRGSENYYVLIDENGLPMTQIAENILRDEHNSPYNSPTASYTKVAKLRDDQRDKYVKGTPKPNYKEISELKMLLPRIYSSDPSNVQGYKGWSLYEGPDFSSIPLEVRQRWASQGFASLDEVKQYLPSYIDVATNRTADGKRLDYISTTDADGMPMLIKVPPTIAYKPGFFDNLSYFFNYQFSHMYWRYFMWNFAGRQNDLAGNGEPHLGNWISGIPFIDNARLGDQSLLPSEFGSGNKGHNVFFMLPLILGIIGLLWQALYIKPDAPQRGIEQFWVVCFLFLMTGIAIVLYLNQTPGQPRERDYAFAGSFYAFAIWIGLGVPAIGMMLRSMFSKSTKAKAATDDNAAPAAPSSSPSAAIVSAAVAIAVGLLVPLQMVSQTWDDHDRSGRYTARDFGFNYLASVGPNGIIFCNGDNDTFPLWYAQEVEGYRTDVRVVNLSYLTTDWYANQQRIPSYDGKPIDMYAKPTDYAYDKLAYNFVYPLTDSLVTAKDALLDLYATRKDYGVLKKTNMVFPVDSAAAMRAFDINPSDSVFARDVLPFFTDITTNVGKLGRSGINLGNVLSLDIIANSVENGFERPVYFAATVPNSYHMGLTPFLSSTGMAMEVTPFYYPNVAPTVDKAYENIMGEFRWGGLDTEHPEKLYLDETVRRMVSSTRSSIYSTARDLIAAANTPATQWAIDHAKATGAPVPATRGDMGRALLELINTKLPSKAAPFDGFLAMYIAQAYYDLYLASHNPADLDAAQAILDQDMPRYAQLLRYAQSLKTSKVLAMGDSELIGLQYLGAAIALQNRINILRELDKDPAANADILAEWQGLPGYNMLMQVTPLIYINGMTLSDIEKVYDEYEGTSMLPVLEYAALTLRAHEAADIDPMELSEKWMADYGISAPEWTRLVHL